MQRAPCLFSNEAGAAGRKARAIPSDKLPSRMLKFSLGCRARSSRHRRHAIRADLSNAASNLEAADALPLSNNWIADKELNFTVPEYVDIPNNMVSGS